MKLFSILLFTGISFAQTTLPCQRILVDDMKGNVTESTVACGQLPIVGWQQDNNLPDTPSAVQRRNEEHPQDFKTWEAYKNKPARYATIRRWDEPPLRSNKQTFLNKNFLTGEGLMWSSVGADIAVNKGRPGTPTGKDLYIDALVPAAVVSVAHWLTYKMIWAPIGDACVTYVTQRHARGAINQTYP